ncbi:MAG: hypothetical protein FWH35_08720 [Treponema sp.]|nr:hypothetical protein [Treponema sp.]
MTDYNLAGLRRGRGISYFCGINNSREILKYSSCHQIWVFTGNKPNNAELGLVNPLTKTFPELTAGGDR